MNYFFKYIINNQSVKFTSLIRESSKKSCYLLKVTYLCDCKALIINIIN